MGRPSAIAPAPTEEAYVLYEKYQDAALGALWKFFPQYADDEDFQQMARIGLWKGCCEYDPDRGAFLTIAYRAVRSEISHYFTIRNAKGKIPDHMLVALDAPLGHRSTGACENDKFTGHDCLSKTTDLDWVDFRGFLEHLDDHHREVVLMRMQGYTLAECGKCFGITPERVRQQLMETRQLFERYV